MTICPTLLSEYTLKSKFHYLRSGLRPSFEHVADVVKDLVASVEFGHKRRKYDVTMHAAVGCADMSPPPNTVLRRIDDKSEVRCLLNGLTTTLRCVGGQWDGEIGVCERPSFNVQSLGDSFFDRIDVFYNMTYNYISSLHPGMYRLHFRLFVWLYVVQIKLISVVETAQFSLSCGGAQLFWHRTFSREAAGSVWSFPLY